MFAEKTDLNLEFDPSEAALVELNAADIEDVSGGGLIPLVFITAYAFGYYNNRD
ncbi:MAG: hypothetical protein ACK5JR_16000 [Tropicimonas sp.]|uniref:hypothetical protein n=1 Tax=Tropicimonas sp. TaxID=2067044 RepID=UPI003A8AEB68